MKKIFLSILLFVFIFAHGQNFTDTKGELAITSSGQSTYTLPIAVPPSIKNVAPIINLTYSSGSMGGIAGQGWHINSISSISRIASRLDLDGIVDGVDFDDNDKLALDGQRLILKSGVYWENNSTYETEFKSNSRIELFTQGNDRYFIVTAPDGSRSWYGSTGSGTVIASTTSWYIVRFEDVHGNYIKYNYDNAQYTGAYFSTYGVVTSVDTHQYYIKDIEFSGNETAGVTLTNKIEFNYRATPATRVERTFINGEYSYAFKILDNIKVLTGGALFRRYQMTQVADPVLGYEHLTQIQEFNGLDEPANPVEFTYNTTPDTSARFVTYYENNMYTKDIKASGDFDGDGKIDFITSTLMYKNLFVTGTNFPPIALPHFADDRRWFAAATLSNGKLNQFQSLVFADESPTATVFKVYNAPGNAITLSYSKSISIDNSIWHNIPLDEIHDTTSDSPGDGYNFCFDPIVKPDTKYYEGDYNGDGLSEVLITSKKDEYYFKIFTYIHSTSSEHDAAYCDNLYPSSGTDFYWVNLDPNTSNTLGSNGYVKLENADALDGGKLYVMDFNGDGKADVLSIFPDYTYKVVGFKHLNTAPWVEIEVLGSGSMPNYAYDKTVLFGDYNGDGKMDVMVPEMVNSPHWYIYYSNPRPDHGAFFQKEMMPDLLPYLPRENANYSTQAIYNEYYAADVNKDGKTDLVRFHKRGNEQGLRDFNSYDSEYFYQVMVNNIGNPSMHDSFSNVWLTPTFTSSTGTMPITIAANPKFLGLNQEFIVLWNDNEMDYITFLKDAAKDCQLISVSEASGKIKQDIEYQQMIAPYSGLGSGTDFYSSSDGLSYPFIEMKKADTFLVSKLKATINGVSKFQDFKYNGYVLNLHGLGSLGFKKAARSSWYLNSSDTKIWTIDNNDPMLRGATTVSWTNTNAATVLTQYRITC